jgi:hypothetical protein
MKVLSMLPVAGLALSFTLSVCAQEMSAIGPTMPGVKAIPTHAVSTNLAGVYAFTQPPANFNPLTASADELKAWGYPPRPGVSEGEAALVRWKEAVNPAFQRQVPDLVRTDGVYHRQATGVKVLPGRSNGTAVSSSNWSGFALVPSSGAAAYYSIAGRWTVPTVKQPKGTCSGGWDYSSQWVGLGGFNDADLLQAGSAANVFCDIGNSIPEYFPWLEWLPESELVLYQNAANSTLFPFAPGDYLNVTVWATNFSGSASTTGNLHFIDVTQGWSVSLTFSAASVGGSEVTGNSAEWIVERTEVNSTLATLPNYFADPWWYTIASDRNSVAHYPNNTGAATAYNITMLDDSNAPVSFVDVFGWDSLWFFPEGSAVK